MENPQDISMLLEPEDDILQNLFSIDTSQDLSDDGDILQALFEDDTIFPEYNSWEEIPVSNLTFASNTSQVCYVSLPKDKAITALKEQVIPVKTIAYEYIDEVTTKTNEVKLAVEIETKHMLDLTHKIDYEEYIKSKINGTPINSNISLIRKVIMTNEMNQFKVVYVILNNSCVKRVHKI